MIRFQRFRNPLIIDSRHSKLVLMSWHEVLDLGLGVLGLQSWHPASCLSVELLYQVVVDGSTAVV